MPTVIFTVRWEMLPFLGEKSGRRNRLEPRITAGVNVLTAALDSTRLLCRVNFTSKNGEERVKREQTAAKGTAGASGEAGCGLCAALVRFWSVDPDL
ncbi:hypothetical protein CB1_000164018 [Camelus ferus]|nr:hypothetical protein CB1_000164018 [Camelus ferus]